MCRISTVFDSLHSFLQIQIFLLSEELPLIFLIINYLFVWKQTLMLPLFLKILFCFLFSPSSETIIYTACVSLKRFWLLLLVFSLSLSLSHSFRIVLIAITSSLLLFSCATSNQLLILSMLFLISDTYFSSRNAIWLIFISFFSLILVSMFPPLCWIWGHI